MKITIVTCYDQNDYVRARSLRAALQATPGVETRIIKNLNKGLKRYIEVPIKLLKELVSDRPDAYVLTFRGYEMLPFLLLIKGRRPLVFDEFLNPAEYLAEHGKLKLDGKAAKLFIWWYRSLLKRCKFMLADTDAHADYSSELCNVPREKFIVLPVNADEKLFYPQPWPKSQKEFKIFYYGNGMTPLHGLEFVLQAAVALKDKTDIHLTIIGGKTKAEAACAEAMQQGANITYKTWVPFEDMPAMVAESDLCLGGPFGKTLQSQFVITGKTYQFLAAERPVVVGKNLATESFKDKENCLLVEQGEAQSVLNTIIWAYEHQEELKSIAQKGRQLYETQFSQAIVNGKIAQLVEQL